MAVTRNDPPCDSEHLVCTALNRGPLGLNDWADPGKCLGLSDTPGTVGLDERPAGKSNYVLAPDQSRKAASAPRLYANGPYTVEVAADGAIRVRSGDWLSKYSAAIHNDFTRVHEFGRKTRSGVIQRIVDYDRIYAGETLYHLPSVADSVPPSKPVSAEQGKKIILATLAADLNLRGANLELLSSAIDIVGYADSAALIAEVGGLIAEGTLIASAAGAISVASMILTPIGLLLGVMNAAETGLRMHGMYAASYAATAWAFDHAIPENSKKRMKILSLTFRGEKLKRYEKAWKDASTSTVQALDGIVVEKKVEKKSLQTLLRAVGKDNPQQVCRAYMKGFEENLDGQPLNLFRKSCAEIPYPE